MLVSVFSEVLQVLSRNVEHQVPQHGEVLKAHPEGVLASFSLIGWVSDFGSTCLEGNTWCLHAKAVVQSALSGTRIGPSTPPPSLLRVVSRDRSLSRDCFKIDKGKSAMGSNEAALQDTGIRHAKVRLLSLKVDTEAVLMGVAKKGAGEVCIRFRQDSQSLLI